ncbi:hypothetical protein [Streptomyces sp. SID5910]|uniref:hypothetical protein n=1 Tax=Streptomyces sp. SID5910 TaxID=2690312 RepID=UPI00136F43CD|nr:hypothetical protein [Streptomyces sp. SID5910]MYR41413.1 hypothetical protein [Streptomyces sp. SID5910]
MNKPMRHVVTTGIAAVGIGGALLAGAGSATAAPPQHRGHSARPAAAPAGHHHHSRRSGSHQRVDPWVMGQIRQFDPAAAQRLAVYDPWVKDQLAQFAGQTG